LRTGRLPFAGDAPQVMFAKLQTEPILEGLPDEERAVAARALAKDPAQRWPSCREFAQHLGFGARSVGAGSVPPWDVPTVPATSPRPDAGASPGAPSRPPADPPPLLDSPERARQIQSQWDGPVRWSNGLGMEFRLIPPGRFLMGAAPGDPAAQADE